MGFIWAKVTAIDSLQDTPWKAKGNKGRRNFAIRFLSGQCPLCKKDGYRLNCPICKGKGSIGACDRVIEYRSLKEKENNIENIIKAMKWINDNKPELFTDKCSYDDLLKALEDTKPKAGKRRLASSWTSAVLRYAMDSIENMEALDQRPRPCRLQFS